LLNPGAKRFIILLFPSKNFIVLALWPVLSSF
jgi:hypothetical protein